MIFNFLGGGLSQYFVPGDVDSNISTNIFSLIGNLFLKLFILIINFTIVKIFVEEEKSNNLENIERCVYFSFY